MDCVRKTSDRQSINDGPNPGLLRPPFLFLIAILLGILLSWRWPLHFRASVLWWLGPLLTACAVLLFLFSYTKFRAAGTSVRGSKRTNTIVRTGPYRFSRNPIYVSFILLMLGLSVWLDTLWLLVTLILPIVVIAGIIIPREERFLEHNFSDEYSSYKSAVRRWL